MKLKPSAVNKKLLYAFVLLFAVMVFPVSTPAFAQEVLPATTEDLQQFDEDIANIVANQDAATFGQEVSGAARQLQDADEETRENFGEFVRGKDNFPGKGEDDDGDSEFGQEVSQAAQDLKNSDLESKTRFGEFVINKENFPGNAGNAMPENPAGMGLGQARQMVPSQGEQGPAAARPLDELVATRWSIFAEDPHRDLVSDELPRVDRQRARRTVRRGPGGSWRGRRLFALASRGHR